MEHKYKEGEMVEYRDADKNIKRGEIYKLIRDNDGKNMYAVTYDNENERVREGDITRSVYMNWNEFQKTDTFKNADCVYLCDEDGYEVDDDWAKPQSPVVGVRVNDGFVEVDVGREIEITLGGGESRDGRKNTQGVNYMTAEYVSKDGNIQELYVEIDVASSPYRIPNTDTRRMSEDERRIILERFDNEGFDKWSEPLLRAKMIKQAVERGDGLEKQLFFPDERVALEKMLAAENEKSAIDRSRSAKNAKGKQNNTMER